MKVRDYIADDEPTTPADDARANLDTIARGWRHVLDPIHTTGSGVSQGGIRPATEDEREEPPDARLDTPRVLAFWVHAALDEWPTILQTLEPDEHGNLHLVTTQSIDCTDVPAMARLLHREVDRIVDWVEPGHDYGHTFTSEITALARAVKRVAWPPKGDRLTIGECPTCGRRVRVKAPTWLHLPQPTTNPATYPEWAWLPNNARPITCRCGVSDNLQGWIARIVPFEEREPMKAEELVEAIRVGLGMRYSPLTVRVWARRGLVKSVGKSKDGHATFDLTQVMAMLINREKRRDARVS